VCTVGTVFTQMVRVTSVSIQQHSKEFPYLWAYGWNYGICFHCTIGNI